MISDLIQVALMAKDKIDPETNKPIDPSLLFSIIKTADTSAGDKKQLASDTISLITGENK
jgi:hypothetical protein